MRDDFKKKHGRRLLFSHKSKSNNSVSLSLCKEKTARCVGTDSGFKTRKKQQKKKKQMRVWFKDNKSTNQNNNAASHLKREGANKQTNHRPTQHPQSPEHHHPDATNQTQPSATTQMGQNQTKHSKSQNTNGGGRKKAHVCMGSNSSSAAEKRRREKCVR